MIPKILEPPNATLFQLANENGIVTYNGTFLRVMLVNLSIVAPASMTFSIQGFMRNISGGKIPYSDSVTVNADNGTRRNVVTRQFPLADGKLLSFSVMGDLTGSIGFANLSIVSPSGVLATLGAGYVTSYSNVTFPSIPAAVSQTFPGIPFSIQLGNPLAGAAADLAIPYLCNFLVNQIRFQLVAVAAAAARRPYIERIDGGTVHTFLGEATVAAGGGTLIENWHESPRNTVMGTSDTEYFAPAYFRFENTLRISVENMAAADQLSDIFILGLLNFAL